VPGGLVNAREVTMIIRIKARSDAGFRRLGIHFPGTAVEFPTGRFTAEELLLLKAEPQLVVDEVEGELAQVSEDPFAEFLNPDGVTYDGFRLMAVVSGQPVDVIRAMAAEGLQQRREKLSEALAALAPAPAGEPISAPPGTAPVSTEITPESKSAAGGEGSASSPKGSGRGKPKPDTGKAAA
jgi:hypothetical protein